MTEANSPIDINKELIDKYQKDVEESLVGYTYGQKKYSLPDLVSKLDKTEPYIMSPVEQDSYLAIRQGMQIFRATAELLADKTELKQKIAQLPSTTRISTSPELQRLMGFCHNFATYAAAKFIVKKLDITIAANNDQNIVAPELDIDGALKLPNATSHASAIQHVVAPVYKSLTDHIDPKQNDATYEHPLQFAMEMRAVFAQYAKLALENKDSFGDLNRHVENYQFRVLDDFVQLNGYDDKSVPVSAIKKQDSAQNKSGCRITS